MAGEPKESRESPRAPIRGADPRMAPLILSLRSGGVTDPAVLTALEKIPRDLFVPELFKARALEDSALPIACGQTISQPLIVGLMTQALSLESRHRVLEALHQGYGVWGVFIGISIASVLAGAGQVGALEWSARRGVQRARLATA